MCIFTVRTLIVQRHGLTLVFSTTLFQQAVGQGGLVAMQQQQLVQLGMKMLALMNLTSGWFQDHRKDSSSTGI